MSWGTISGKLVIARQSSLALANMIGVQVSLKRLSLNRQ